MAKYILVFLLSLTICQAAYAQRAESGGVGTGAWKLLKQPMNLPDLPKYSGKSAFSSGLMYPNKPDGPAISMTYNAKESPDSVLQWYRDTLQSYSWKIKMTKNQQSVRAVKGKNGVIVKVSNSSAPGFSTRLKISYKLSR